MFYLSNASEVAVTFHSTNQRNLQNILAIRQSTGGDVL